MGGIDQTDFQLAAVQKYPSNLFLKDHVTYFGHYRIYSKSIYQCFQIILVD